MARLKTNGNGRGMTAVFGMARLSVSARAFRDVGQRPCRRRSGSCSTLQIWGRDTAFDRDITYVHLDILPAPTEEEICRTSYGARIRPWMTWL